MILELHIRRRTILFVLAVIYVFGSSVLLQGCSEFKADSFKTYEVSAVNTEVPTYPEGNSRVTDVSCTYKVEETTLVAAGGNLNEKVNCVNLPTSAIVKLVGSKDGAVEIDQVISVTNTLAYTANTMNSGGASMAGVYLRHVEVHSAEKTLLYKSPEVRYIFQPLSAVPAITCRYTLQGTSPIVFGGVITETVRCSNLPENSEVRMIGTKNGINDFDKLITVTNGIPFVDTRTNDTTEKAAVYKRKIIVKDSTNQTVLFTSDEISYVFLLPAVAAESKCKFRITESRDIVFGSTFLEMIYCSNLSDRTEVHLIGTKNGIQDVDKVISVTKPVTNQYSKDNYGDYYFSEARQHDAIEKVGVYTRRIVVKDTVNQNVLFISADERKYEFLPDLGCVVTITETTPGYVVENANCNAIPPGAVVSLYWPDEDGSYHRHTITLPYSLHRKHNEFERLAGAEIRYYYYRDIEVTNESRTIYYAANHFDILILK